jgi:gluconolactonase
MFRAGLLASLSALALLVGCSDSGEGVRRSPGGQPSGGNNGGDAGTGATTGGAGGSGAVTGGASGSPGGTAGDGAGGVGASAGSAGTGAGGGGTVAWSCPPGPFGHPVPAGATPTQIAGLPPEDGYVTMGFYIIEGPVWIGESLYFSQVNGGNNAPPSRILKLTGDTVSVFLSDAGTNGLAVDKEGNLYGARHTDGSIVKFDLANPSNVTPIATLYDSKRFNSPNDLAVRSDGNIYFSDPTHQAPFCFEPTPCNPDIQGFGATRVYRIEKGTGAVSVVDEQLNQPNGVTLSLDENTLFVTAQSGAQGGKLFGYTLDANGAVIASEKLNDQYGGDGMVIDCAGNLYTTNNQDVVVLDPTGKTVVATINIPSSGEITNLAFGGPERKTLFITFLGNTGGIFKVDLAVPGLPY